VKVDESDRPFEHPLYERLLSVPGLDVAVASLDQLLTWGATNSFWVFPMATSCCGIELMAAAASRVDIDRMGAILRPCAQAGRAHHGRARRDARQPSSCARWAT
jgi:hypothetical protein